VLSQVANACLQSTREREVKVQRPQSRRVSDVVQTEPLLFLYVLEHYCQPPHFFFSELSSKKSTFTSLTKTSLYHTSYSNFTILFFNIFLLFYFILFIFS
jgi:hypothetical protein